MRYGPETTTKKKSGSCSYLAALPKVVITNEQTLKVIIEEDILRIDTAVPVPPLLLSLIDFYSRRIIRHPVTIKFPTQKTQSVASIELYWPIRITESEN
jgi:hypothetical protein